MTLAEEFAKRDAHLPKPKWVYGDRVSAKYSEFPLVGMVIRQNEQGVLIHSDLPLALEEGVRYVVYCNLKTVKKLLVFND
jgi:hypothetical protein